MKKKFSVSFREIIIASAIAIVALLFTGEYFFPVEAFVRLENTLLDLRFRERGQVSAGEDPEVVIVAITQESYDQIPAPYNTWPWPRSYYASLIKNLNEAGAKAIGIDIVFSNPDRFSDKNDSLLANVLAENRNVTLAGKININNETLLDNSSNMVFKGGAGLVKKIDENYSNYFYKSAPSIGLVQVIADEDNVFRRYTPYIYSAVNDEKVPSFGFAVLNTYYDKIPGSVPENSEDEFIYSGKTIPKADPSTIFINYYGINTYATFRHVNFIDVIDDKDFVTTDEKDFGTEINTWDNPDYGLKYQGIFKDKIVLVGSLMPEDGDLVAVPVSGGKRSGDNLMYGVEFHGTVIQNVISGRFLSEESGTLEVILIIFAVFAGFFGSSLVRHKKFSSSSLTEGINLLLVGFLLFILYWLSIYLFVHESYIIKVIPTSAGLITGYIGSTIYHFINERKQSSEIKRMFTHYVSESLVNQLVDNPKMLKLGGKKTNLTVMFSDIAGFSTLSESMSPEELVKLMNEYFNGMTGIILDNHGTLDKYIGDAIMAFWGAPVEFDNHAVQACDAALKMKKYLDYLGHTRDKLGMPALNSRIGINTGEVIVGNMGSRHRFDFTVMGDTVNLAARLESANKQYGTCIMISEYTAAETGDRFILRDLDYIRVKGKTHPTRVYELLGEKGDTDKETEKKLHHYYAEALAAYRAADFESAESLFIRYAEFNPEDEVTGVYLERLNYFKKNPPPADWDGVFTLETK